MSFISIHSPVPDGVLCFSINLLVSSPVPDTERALEKILPQQSTKSMFPASPSLPQENTQPCLAPGAPPPPQPEKPELAPLGEESGDQLSAPVSPAPGTPGSGPESQWGSISQLSWGTLALPQPL